MARPRKIRQSSHRIPAPSNHRPREARNVYTSLAGRIRYPTNSDRDYTAIYKDATISVTPDDVLLKKFPAAAVRLEEHPDLPESDLVNALHLYVSELYQCSGSMNMLERWDETALLGLAVIVEETIKESLKNADVTPYAVQETN